jgi:hypothetical protein
MDDLERIKKAGKSRVDVTVGSALDIFGGDLPYKEVAALLPASVLHTQAKINWFHLYYTGTIACIAKCWLKVSY